MSNADNRSVTLKGQNKIFGYEESGIQIHHDEELGYYYLDFEGTRWAKPTLTKLCQVFVKHLIESRSPLPAEVKTNG